ncbi:MAG TPA: hypothetical protein VJT72_21400 [Pseudonocardiaceae bacterium]|nr:hypothetical protein [Pseudonocardiaceae bacterium]
MFWGTGETGDVVSSVLVSFDALAADVLAAVTMKATVGDVDPLWSAALAGVNTALSWCGPTVNFDVRPDAVPLAVTMTGLPMGVVPSWNCTVPAAPAGVTAAVSVTSVFSGAVEAGVVVRVVVVGAAWAIRGGGAAVDTPLVSDASPVVSNAPPVATVTTRVPDNSRVKNLFFCTIGLFLFG